MREWFRIFKSSGLGRLRHKRQICSERKSDETPTVFSFWFVLVLAACISFAQNQVSDKAVQRIQKEVRHELLMLPYFGVFDNIGLPKSMVTK